jgi:hypothetical protein
MAHDNASQIRLSYATSSIFVGWWRGMQGVPQITLFLFAARALIGSKNIFLVDDKCSHRSSTRNHRARWRLLVTHTPESVHLATAAYHV